MGERWDVDSGEGEVEGRAGVEPKTPLDLPPRSRSSHSINSATNEISGGFASVLIGCEEQGGTYWVRFPCDDRSHEHTPASTASDSYIHLVRH